MRFLHFNLGFDVKAQMHDTQVMAWLINETTRLDLAFLSNRYLGKVLDKTLQKKASTTPYDDIAAYCRKDVSITRELYYELRHRLAMAGLLDYFEGVEAPFTKVLRDMELRGMPIDIPAAVALSKTYQTELDRIQASLTAGMPAAFNLRSPSMVSKYLGSSKFVVRGRVARAVNDVNKTLDKLAGESPPDIATSPAGTFITTKEGRKWDTGMWVVQGHPLAHPVVEGSIGPVTREALLSHPSLAKDLWVADYLRFKKLDKVIGTYLNVFTTQSRSGRIHGRFNQTGTTTGRLSSSEPNLQNIPARGPLGVDIRRLFRGNLVVGDFGQLEPRLMAHFSQDSVMLDVFRQNRDLYQEVASRVGCSRDVAKTLVLAMSYGAGRQKVVSILQQSGHPIDVLEAGVLLERLSHEFKGYFGWREHTIMLSKTSGYVSTIDGRKRHLDASGDAFSWKDPAAPGRQAANAVVQGSAADVVRRVMLHTSRMFPDLRLLAQVHDELVYEVDGPHFGDAELLKRLNEWTLRIAQRGLTVPLVYEAHYGTSWFEAKEGTWTA